jgi:RNA polymerase sigma factor (sigma-70 family)
MARMTPSEPVAATAELGGGRAGFVNFYDREYPQVLRFLMRFGASLQAAEDAGQQAFLEAWAMPPGLWADIADPRAWIRTLALRRYWRPPGARRRLLTQPLVDRDIDETPQPGEGHADLTPGTLFVVDALRSLDSDSRAVMAFHLDGFKAPEIAVQLGITGQQARDLLKKARKILGRKLAGLEYAPAGTSSKRGGRTR